MRILFVENRHKTAFWEIIAENFLAQGHEIFWIVQNHFFKPKNGKVYEIPYYRGAPIEHKNYTANIEKIVKSNRGLNYFGIRKDDFIFYYYSKIESAIADIKPGIVFGESTQFHELITIDVCKKQRIMFLHPCTCRYPAGRFSFYEYDTLTPYGGSGEKLTDEAAMEVISGVVDRKVVPDYMKKTKPKVSKATKIADKMLLSLGYYLGEKFNTPSPFFKMKLEKKRKVLVASWDLISIKDVPDDTTFKVLYPLQMQPEANIDVWGYPNNNQLTVIKNIVAQMKQDDTLYLKPNPKSKYELSEELIQYVEANKDRVKVFSHETPMVEVLKRVDAVVTVTGTISFECIWSGKPVMTLGQGIQNRYASQTLLNNESFEQLKRSEKVTEQDKIDLVNLLVKTSFVGQTADNYEYKYLLSNQENLNNVFFAFNNVLALASK